MKAVRDGSVRLNGKKTQVGARLCEGDRVETPWQAEERRSEFETIGRLGCENLVTLFRNGDLWCLEKPAGLLSQPDRRGGDSLITRAWGSLEWRRSDFRPALISRLDRNVSGVEAIAMNAPSLRAMSESMRRGRIGKIYVAVVHGDAPQTGEIAVPLCKDEGKNFVRPAAAGEKGRDAMTLFRKLSGGDGFSTLELRLATGRPHQARAHLACIGHPIVGDAKYGAAERGKRRLMLHAHIMSFPESPELPGSLRGLEVVSPVPDDFHYFR
jgi:23S rRNA pseudouridine955/2504/2580 synthase